EIVARQQDCPERAFAQTERREVVFRALSKLPCILRDAVRLRELQGLAYDEVARVMRIPVGTVKSRVNRGRLMLSLMLKDFKAAV
ncbi:MAG: RNA polymerase sigma factor, partial [Acidobacteriota bacterium]|nr:RNA polymerase sigma factor [Acidobacteriota bacterium]